MKPEQVAFNEDVPPIYDHTQRKLNWLVRGDWMALWQFGPAPSLTDAGELIWCFARDLTRLEWMTLNPFDYFSKADQGYLRVCVCARVTSTGTLMGRVLALVPHGVALPANPAELAFVIETRCAYQPLADMSLDGINLTGAQTMFGPASMSGAIFAGWIPQPAPPAPATPPAPPKSFVDRLRLALNVLRGERA